MVNVRSLLSEGVEIYACSNVGSEGHGLTAVADTVGIYVEAGVETTAVACTVVVSVRAKSLTTVVTSVTVVVTVCTLAYAILAANVTLVVHIACNIVAGGNGSFTDITLVILASV